MHLHALNSIAPRIPLGREQRKWKGEDRGGMRYEKIPLKDNMSSCEFERISAIANLMGGTDRSLSESGHSKSFRKSDMSSFELEFIIRYIEPEGGQPSTLYRNPVILGPLWEEFGFDFCV